MSTIPTSVTEDQFEQHIRPYLRTAKRGYECKIVLYKVFNYLLKRLYTGCQWQELAIAADPSHPEKKRFLGRQFTITGRNGMLRGVLKKSGSTASRSSKVSWIVSESVQSFLYHSLFDYNIAPYYSS